MDKKESDLLYSELQDDVLTPAFAASVKKHLTPEEQKEQEQLFYDIQEKYLETGEKKYWDQMFMMVNKTVLSSFKQKLVGIYRDDIFDLAMQATLDIMSRYKDKKRHPNGYRIQYLLTVAHWATVGVLYNSKLQFQDRQESYESWISFERNKEKGDR